MSIRTLDTVVSQDEIVVFAPPPQVDIITEIGPQGTRGSKIWVGAGDPSPITIPNYEEVIVGDLYININSGSPNYSWMWQFVATPGGTTWKKVVKINPALYNGTHTVNFTGGVGTTNIPLEYIAETTATLSDTNFSVLVTMDGEPTAVGIARSFDNAAKVLTITINATQFSGGSWTPLEGVNSANLLVRLITGEVDL